MICWQPNLKEATTCFLLIISIRKKEYLYNPKVVFFVHCQIDYKQIFKFFVNFKKLNLGVILVKYH